jgi:hypothetical protein
VQPENVSDAAGRGSVVVPPTGLLTAAAPPPPGTTTAVITTQDMSNFQEMLKESLTMDMTA